MKKKIKNIFRKLGLSNKKKVSNDGLIRILNSKVLYNEKELLKYIDKYLKNEEKWKIVNRILNNINSIFDIQLLCKTTIEELANLISFETCSIVLYNSIKKQFHIEALYSVDCCSKISCMEEFIRVKNLEAASFFRDINTLSKTSINKFLQKDLQDNFYIFPMFSKGEFQGFLLIYKSADLSKEEINILDLVVESFSMAVRNSNLYTLSKQGNSHKTEFIASLSHEFKTPLNAIIGFGEILHNSDDLEKNIRQKYLQNILVSASHLLDLIDDILDASRLESGNFELFFEKFNTKTIITETIQTFEQSLNKKNIKCNPNLVDINIECDLKRFRQIVYNLLSNAIKFSDQNGKINIITYLKDDNFYFEIIDNGEGISVENKDKLFEFFYQASNKKKGNPLKRSEGSGIGLAICKKIIDMHKGQIDFDSELGKGSTFWFSLPVCAGVDNALLEFGTSI